MTKETNSRKDKMKTVSYNNQKIMKTYHNAYNSYQSACERYERLMKAYKDITKPETETRISLMPNTIKVMRKMIEEAHREKCVIAEHARECIRHLNTLKFEM